MFARGLVCVLTIATMFALGVSSAGAEPTSGLVNIQYMRPYIGGTGDLVYLSGVGPCGQQTGAYGIYTIDLSSLAGRTSYAAMLVAIAASRQVQLEVAAGAYGSQYPALQSVYLGS